MTTPKNTGDNSLNKNTHNDPKNKGTERDENTNPRKINDDDDEELDIEEPVTDWNDDAIDSTQPGQSNRENRNDDPEINPQHIDPKRTDENPGKQRERERNPNT